MRMIEIDYSQNWRKWNDFKESAFEQINMAFCKLRRIGCDDRTILAIAENLLQKIPELEEKRTESPAKEDERE